MLGFEQIQAKYLKSGKSCSFLIPEQIDLQNYGE